MTGMMFYNDAADTGMIMTVTMTVTTATIGTSDYNDHHDDKCESEDPNDDKDETGNNDGIRDWMVIIGSAPDSGIGLLETPTSRIN